MGAQSVKLDVREMSHELMNMAPNPHQISAVQWW